jgi:nuclear cap-binding protein subunit 2
MCELYNILKAENSYFDRLNYTQEEYNAALDASSTVYVGNLSFHTTQDSIRELFSLAGKVVEIIMGINK